MIRSILIIICGWGFFSGTLYAKTVCLNMIVKNEKDVIQRSLESVKNLIDYWVIVDTGSTDGTQQKIREILKDIPGELHQRPWVNFGHNRNEALQLAKGKGDYALFIDADEELHGIFNKNQLFHDLYFVTVRISVEPHITFQRTLLINNHLDWTWQGVIHEKLVRSDTSELESDCCAVLQDLILCADTKDGYRAKDPNKYLKDASVLEKALIEEPDNSDYVYYLAQSYFNAQELPLALKNYRKRAKMSGFDQHTFWAKYMVGVIQETMKLDSEAIIQSYCDAYQFRPTRAEPIFRLANLFFKQENYLLGYMTARAGLSIPMPSDMVYVEESIYYFGMLSVFGNCAAMLGIINEAKQAFELISKMDKAPDWLRENALKSLQSLQDYR